MIIEKVKEVCRILHDKSRCIGKICLGAALSIAPAFRFGTFDLRLLLVTLAFWCLGFAYARI